MLCKICSVIETDYSDGICDDCKFCIIDDKWNKILTEDNFILLEKFPSL